MLRPPSEHRRPRSQVELFEESKRHRLRVRLLERVLVDIAIAAEAAKTTLPEFLIPEISTADVAVDATGTVHGAAQAVRAFTASRRSY